MTRTGQDAADYARSRVGGQMSQSGLCLQFVRTCFDVGSYYGSAIEAWHGSQWPHPGDRNPPMSVPLYFATPSSYDHVVIGVDGGAIVTTFNADIRLYDGPSSSAIAAIERDFDGSYLGWAEDINGVRIYTAGEDEDMSFDDTDRESLNECRRMLGIAFGYNPPANSTEQHAVQVYQGISENAAEARRGTGVTNGALAPAPGEWTIPAQVETLAPPVSRDHTPLSLAIVAIVLGIGAVIIALTR